MHHDKRVVRHWHDFFERFFNFLRSRARRNVDVEAVPSQKLVTDPAARDEGDVAGVIEPVVVGGSLFCREENREEGKIS